MRKRLAKAHEHVANKRKDFIEKLSYKLVHENDVIVVETLSLKDIAKFKTWEERKNSADKSNHGKSTCNHCGYVNKDLTIEDREWTCPKCGSKLIRDVNAA